MATEAVQICNMALRRIGSSKTIDDLETDATEEAAACRDLYEPARDFLLAERPWPFAIKRAELAELVTDERAGWEFVYSLPVDCLIARSIWAGMRQPPVESRIPFATEHDASVGTVLLTDLEATATDPVVLLYTARVETVTLYPPGFVETLAWRLAADLAIALAVEGGMEERARRKADEALARAFSIARGEGYDPDPDPELIRVRG